MKSNRSDLKARRESELLEASNAQQKKDTYSVAKTKRFTIDLTPAAAEEVERIRNMFRLSIKDVFSFGLVLISLYADALRDKQEVQIVNPENPNVVKVIKLPLFAGDVA